MAHISATGYVHALIDNNLTFPEFAWECARAIGYMVSMRDEPMGVAIPVTVEPDPYYAERVADARAELLAWEALTPAQKAEKVRKDREPSKVDVRRHCKDRQGDFDKLRATLAEVQKWQPPTPEHVGLKDFMLHQLLQCDEKPNRTVVELQEIEAGLVETAVADIQASYEQSLAYAVKSHQEHLDYIAKKNAWIAALVAAIGPPPKPRTK